MENVYQHIKKRIEMCRPHEALELVDRFLQSHDEDASLYYLKGSAYMKLGNWQQAINCFLLAEKLDYNSPAVEARKMLQDIMEFYNKDMYNQ